MSDTQASIVIEKCQQTLKWKTSQTLNDFVLSYLQNGNDPQSHTQGCQESFMTKFHDFSITVSQNSMTFHQIGTLDMEWFMTFPKIPENFKIPEIP